MITRGLTQKYIFDGQMLNTLVSCYNFIMIRQEAVVETLYHNHGQNDEAVLVGLVGTAQRVRNVPG